MARSDDEPRPEGISSLLDTDLYKLTMQSAVLKYFHDVEVTYEFTNRTPVMRLTREAYDWLKVQINRLGNLAASPEEIAFLRKSCPYLSEQYLRFLSGFRMQPDSQVISEFTPVKDTGSPADEGDLVLRTKGRWVDTILYEIPLLSLTSEAYFKFVDRDWSYDGQRESAKEKGIKLSEAGCNFSEFGTRRRRDYHTQELVVQGLLDANKEIAGKNYKGKFAATSNPHFAMRLGTAAIGTVAHEWFMGVAAMTRSYSTATETALRYWISSFGKGVLGIVLTDTFGTPHFLEAFKLIAPNVTAPEAGAATTSASSGPTISLSTTIPPIAAEDVGEEEAKTPRERYADVFQGVRQDSGDPLEFVKTMREFYDREGITDKKTIVFSDSLNVDLCIKYREVAEEAGFLASFGVGTFLTNDFKHISNGEKSKAMNIVIKLSSANGTPAVKISDNIGKNTGDKQTVDIVKKEIGYREHDWADGDESKRL